MKNSYHSPDITGQLCLWLMLTWIFLSPAFCQSVQHPVHFLPGRLVLQSGTKLVGKLSYDQEREIVLLRTGGILKAFSAYQVRSFQFAEESVGVLRQFAPYEFRKGGHGIRLIFFEVVVAGPLSVLRRNTNPWQKNLQKFPSSQPSLTYDYLTDFNYYVHLEGRLLPMSRFRKKVLPLLLAKYPLAVAEVAKQKKWFLLTLADQIRLINAYNFLETRPPLLPDTEPEGLPISKRTSLPDALTR